MLFLNHSAKLRCFLVSFQLFSCFSSKLYATTKPIHDKQPEGLSNLSQRGTKLHRWSRQLRVVKMPCQGDGDACYPPIIGIPYCRTKHPLPLCKASEQPLSANTQPNLWETPFCKGKEKGVVLAQHYPQHYTKQYTKHYPLNWWIGTRAGSASPIIRHFLRGSLGGSLRGSVRGSVQTTLPPSPA